MKKMRIIGVAVLLCAMMPGLSQLGQAVDTAISSKHVVKKKRSDTLLVVMDRDIDVDTVIRRPLYKLNDNFLERLIDSFDMLSIKLLNHSNTLYQNPYHKNNYVISGSFAFDVPDSMFSFDSIKGMYMPTRVKNYGVTIYNINDSVLDGFGFSKTADSVFVSFWKPEVKLTATYDNALLINEKKRESTHYQFGIFRNDKLLDYDDFDQLRWINDVSRRPGSTNSRPK